MPISACFISEIVAGQARAALVFEFSGLVYGFGSRGWLRGTYFDHFKSGQVNHNQSPTILVDEHIAACTTHIALGNRWNHCAATGTTVKQIVIFRNIACVLKVGGYNIVFIENHLICSRSCSV
jgi:hypothetical protein